jgi:hypothetical protein
VFAALFVAARDAYGEHITNKKDVRQGIEDKWEKVLWGPELSEEEYAKAVATTGKSLATYVDRLQRWLKEEVGEEVPKKVIRDWLFRGKAPSNRGIGAGIASYNHKEVVRTREIKNKKWKVSIPSKKIAEVPLPNTHQPWVGIQRR